MPFSASSPGFRALFTPKLATVLGEGYRGADLRADAVAGLTVAIVALPLSMAIAIASGTTPDRGLFTAIVGGFFVSLLGGSRFQIGGPAGAFIVLVAATIDRHGIDGLILATMLSGFILIAVGFLRLGTYIKFIPFPVTVGFTAGIALIIFSSQLKELLGLTLPEKEPADIVPKLEMLWAALPSWNAAAVGIATLTVGTIVVLRRLRPRWPSLLIAVVVASVAVALLDLSVATIGSRFGGIPRALPVPSLPSVSPAQITAVLPDAIAFSLLGAIESLLSAVVADGMSGRRHRSNCELVAQGIANIASALFGGICVTGTIARTATNVRAGARSPFAGMLHAVFLLLFMLIAAPLAAYIPLAALAGVLAVVAWNMAERHTFVALLRSGWAEAAVLLSTLLLTVFRDLTEGIVVGFSIGALVFLDRMAKTISIEASAPLVPEDTADSDREGSRTHYEAARNGMLVFRLSGAFFFGSASTFGLVLDRVTARPKVLVLDFSAVPLLDSTAANVLHAFAHKVRRSGAKLYLIGTTHTVRQVLFAQDLKPPLVRYKNSVDEVRRTIAGGAAP